MHGHGQLIYLFFPLQPPELISAPLRWGQQTFFCKEPSSKYFKLCLKISISTTKICHYIRKSATDSMGMNGQAYVPNKFYVREQVAGSIRQVPNNTLRDHSRPLDLMSFIPYQNHSHFSFFLLTGKEGAWKHIALRGSGPWLTCATVNTEWGHGLIWVKLEEDFPNEDVPGNHVMK